MAVSTNSQLLSSSININYNISLNAFSACNYYSKTGLMPSSSDNNHRLRKPLITIPKIVASRKSEAAGRRDRNFHGGGGGGGRLVDENMIVLRKRIHEMKMVERNYEPPSHWAHWEKRYYTVYDALVCQLMGFLQTQLMNTRPSLALGMAVLILLSVPTSSALVFFHFVEIVKGVLAGTGVHVIS